MLDEFQQFIEKQNMENSDNDTDVAGLLYRVCVGNLFVGDYTGGDKKLQKSKTP